ncbi:response regulator [Candidatus Kaiserbacteria bacterium]|nr:response regulator [Candidatus Kaiserbacteria bacterium]
MSTQKVLIVEDEKPMAKALALKLGHEGVEAEVVHDGKEGLEKARTGGYALIILDLIMPVMDGFTFLETLKKEGVKTPVVVASNLSQEGDAERAKKLGAVDYFIKSNTPLADIVAHITKILNA